MMNCPKCNSLFDEKSKWGIKKFCSRSCANSRIRTEEIKLSVSKALKGRRTRPPLTITQEKTRLDKFKETALKKYLNTPFEELGMENRRRRVMEEQNHACKECELTEWRGRPITLELEHIDGNNKNNNRDNLIGLCPNCHSMTGTWRGRNKSIKKDNTEITNEYLLECLLSSKNIAQGLEKAGLVAKGKNYQRAAKLISTIQISVDLP